MKKYLHSFRNVIRFITSIFASREFALIYCVIGTIGQVAHTYYLTSSISSLEGNWKIAQAMLLSIFISSSLLYFTAISDNEQTEESKKIHLAVTLFTVIEILINIYYYTRHLIIDGEQTQWFDFVFSVMISCLIPITIKLYSSHIRAKEWFDEFAEDKPKVDVESVVDKEELIKIYEMIEQDKKELLDHISELKTFVEENKSSDGIDNVTNLVKTFIEESENKNLAVDEQIIYIKQQLDKIKFTDLEDKISSIFNDKSQKFLTQFENKLKMLQAKNDI